MSISRLKKLPFTKEGINAYRLSDEVSLVWLYCGSNAWDAKKDCNGRSVILPPQDDPADYDWSFLQNQTVIAQALGHTEERYRKLIAFYVLKAGAKQVLFILPEEEQEFQIGGLTAIQMVKCHDRYGR